MLNHCDMAAYPGDMCLITVSDVTAAENDLKTRGVHCMHQQERKSVRQTRFICFAFTKRQLVPEEEAFVTTNRLPESV
ncbi:hypothetical protein DPMN_142432 [Dreissena polymorpha]|uniref:Uncharacterized protein n=1 Tax=Dreissena polymorpha TaxID=45954 RepID=A0A9D4GEJ4_DREPO|nr:hypothetical protein DPMN_142432 [Dreissena polymorpha]